MFWELGQTEDGKKALYNPQSLNSYSYAQNNPITFKDPSGRCAWDACVGETAAMVGREMLKGAIYGAATDIAIQGAYDLHNGKMSSSDTYIQAGIIGASTGAATFGGSAYLKAGRATADIGGKVLSKTSNIDSVVDNIVNHSFYKHIEKGKEFGGIIKTESQLAEYVKNVLTNPSDFKILEKGREAFWDSRLGGVIIKNTQDITKSTVMNSRELGKKLFDVLK